MFAGTRDHYSFPKDLHACQGSENKTSMEAFRQFLNSQQTGRDEELRKQILHTLCAVGNGCLAHLKVPEMIARVKELEHENLALKKQVKELKASAVQKEQKIVDLTTRLENIPVQRVRQASPQNQIPVRIVQSTPNTNANAVAGPSHSSTQMARTTSYNYVQPAQTPNYQQPNPSQQRTQVVHHPQQQQQHDYFVSQQPPNVHFVQSHNPQHLQAVGPPNAGRRQSYPNPNSNNLYSGVDMRAMYAAGPIQQPRQVRSQRSSSANASPLEMPEPSLMRVPSQPASPMVQMQQQSPISQESSPATSFPPFQPHNQVPHLYRVQSHPSPRNRSDRLVDLQPTQQRQHAQPPPNTYYAYPSPPSVFPNPRSHFPSPTIVQGPPQAFSPSSHPQHAMIAAHQSGVAPQQYHPTTHVVPTQGGSPTTAQTQPPDRFIVDQGPNINGTGPATTISWEGRDVIVIDDEEDVKPKLEKIASPTISHKYSVQPESQGNAGSSGEPTLGQTNDDDALRVNQASDDGAVPSHTNRMETDEELRPSVSVHQATVEDDNNLGSTIQPQQEDTPIPVIESIVPTAHQETAEHETTRGSPPIVAPAPADDVSVKMEEVLESGGGDDDRYDDLTDVENTERRPVPECVGMMFYDDENDDERYCFYCDHLHKSGNLPVRPNYSDSSMRELVGHIKVGHPEVWRSLRGSARDTNKVS